MQAVDEALVKWPWLDEERLGVTGGSYGGYMTNLIVGHTKRFKRRYRLNLLATGSLSLELPMWDTTVGVMNSRVNRG